MRLLLAAFAIAALAPNAAMASSFVTVSPPQPGATPSIVKIGAPVDPAREIATFIGRLIQLASPTPKDDQSRMVTVSASIVKFGDTAPPVTMEKVAAIGKRQNLPEPMVMRGGIAGGAFSTPEAAPDVAVVPDEPAQEQAAPGETTPSTVRGSGYGGAVPASGDEVAERPAASASAPAASTPAPAQPTAQREGPTPQ